MEKKPKPTRSVLKKQFFAGKITAAEFTSLIGEVIRYRGFHFKDGGKPKWSGPFRDTRQQANDDNAPWFDEGYSVDVYEEQK